ncbi:hydrogenase 3 maturation endopeptidase HyCI [candidate division NPL-UPA2 bacterium]|nr:hydrogenase 3 maturation endopeptidase HyCI [candidate division NPL-UPA2 bacterium]
MENIFKNILKGKVVIVGIGNTLRGDDGFGPALIERLSAETGLKKGDGTVCLDAGTTPENYIGRVARERPETILIVDAVHLGLKPGKYNILKPSEIIKSGFTTHDISVRMFLDYLGKETAANIYLLGIQPENISLGEEISGIVKKRLEEITDLIKKVNELR